MKPPAFATALCLAATQADAALVHLCWVGGDGYTMTGTMEFPDALLSAPIVTEADVTRFKIAGYHHGQLIGTWDMANRTAATSWYLRYIPATMTFPTDGQVSGPIDQAWNADGTATDCGMPGFGFNAGNYAQDFCLNGVWLESSGVPPATPFKAQTDAPYSADCTGPRLLGKTTRP